ncbi:MAG: hypothetical protein IPM48_05980 [Saprospiraceae bacterium]|nr:hypothetical protein [Saprospiraceae bacterium]
MVDTFTLHSLVRFAYSECNAEENLILKEIAAGNQEIRQEMQILRDAKRMLPKVSFYAKAETLERILAYSQKG